MSGTRPKAESNNESQIQSPKNKLSRQSARPERAPWLLASNLKHSEWSPAKIVAIYKRRVQIEESFRDIKMSIWGWG
ncbi:transposase [Pseudomonas beijingensis]|uniref:transposase n=1 Tax=Pseudomonas beijingensis TaxID=2954101 RepID=UPI0034E4B765